MRILYWTERFWPHIGGVEVLSMQLIPALQARGHEFVVVTSHSSVDLPDEADYNGIPIQRFDFLTSLTNKNLKQLMLARKRLAELKQTFRPDLVHIHFSGPSGYFHMQTHNAHPAPTVVTIHSVPNQMSRDNSLLVKTLSFADWVNTVSGTMLEDLRALIPEIRPCSSVIYNGLDMPDTQPEPLPFDGPTLLCLGRLVDWKGFDVALKAFSMLTDRFPRLRLIVAGDGPAKPDLERQAEDLGVMDRVDFKGWVDPDEVPGLLNAATIVLIPSRADETLPVVALQTAQMARPAVAMDIAGLPEIVLDQQTGLLVAPEDSAGFAEAVAQLLSAPDRATQLGQAAREQAMERFGLETCVEAYDALYRTLA